MLIANGKFSRANIDANNALNGNMTTKEGEKYTQRADETRLLIDELMEKKEPTEEDLQNIEDLKSIDTSSAFSLSPFFRFSMALNAIFF
jgi:hypothetical protein